MALLRRKRPENAPGNLFVDDSCIDCDTCRWMAPSVFDRVGDMSAVTHQPAAHEEELLAMQALLACPTASIGQQKRSKTLGEAQASFPLKIEGDVYHCGYHSPHSFGATAYFLRRPGGNWLIDSPRFTRTLVRKLEEMGGVKRMFLTHSDDVADHELYHQHFGCERILHRGDAQGGLSRMEMLLEGREPIELAAGMRALPVPGHTQGSAVLLVDQTYAFTGDHLAYSARLTHLYAFRSACWFSWEELTASMERLARHSFRWVLPGHGRRYQVPDAEAMKREMERCISWMRRNPA